MTVYVDDMLRSAKVPGARRANWSHLFADTPAELREFARRLGLRPGWVQHAGTHREHFDVTASVRARALELGAEPITYPAGVADLIEARRAVCRCKHLDECTWPRPVLTTADLAVLTAPDAALMGSPEGDLAGLRELQEAASRAADAAWAHRDAVEGGALTGDRLGGVPGALAAAGVGVVAGVMVGVRGWAAFPWLALGCVLGGLVSVVAWASRRWLYIDTRDCWVGYYRADEYHYVCLLPCVVARWRRR